MRGELVLGILKLKNMYHTANEEPYGAHVSLIFAWIYSPPGNQSRVNFHAFKTNDNSYFINILME